MSNESSGLTQIGKLIHSILNEDISLNQIDAYFNLELSKSIDKTEFAKQVIEVAKKKEEMIDHFKYRAKSVLESNVIEEANETDENGEPLYTMEQTLRILGLPTMPSNKYYHLRKFLDKKSTVIRVLKKNARTWLPYQADIDAFKKGIHQFLERKISNELFISFLDPNTEEEIIIEQVYFREKGLIEIYHKQALALITKKLKLYILID